MDSRLRLLVPALFGAIAADRKVVLDFLETLAPGAEAAAAED